MDKLKLKKYRQNKARLSRIDKCIEELSEKEVDVVMGKVIGSSREFPYTQTRTSVQMYDPYENDRINKQIKEKMTERISVSMEIQEVEDYIKSIEDLEVKELFELLYVEGKKQREVAEIVNLDRSRISRKISDYLKTHTKHKNNML